MIYPTPYSIYSRGTVGIRKLLMRGPLQLVPGPGTHVKVRFPTHLCAEVASLGGGGYGTRP